MAQQKSETAAMDKLKGRRVIVMPAVSSDGLRGSSRDIALKNEALVLRDAICGALEVLDLFQHEGGIVLVARGEVRNVGSEQLRWIIQETFVEKRVVRKLPGLKYVVEYRPVNPSELAVRALLRADPMDGGLAGVLPVLNVEQGFATAAAPVEKEITSLLPDDHPEVLASRRTSARYADAAERTRLEGQRGAQVVEKHRQGRQVATDPSAREPIAEESYPAQLPGKAEDSEPASSQA
jgi:hypothetical protein